MRLTVVGANGRMGRALIAAIQQRKDIELCAVLVRKGSPFVNKDASILINSDVLDIRITDDPESAFSNTEGIIDFLNHKPVFFMPIMLLKKVLYILLVQRDLIKQKKHKLQILQKTQLLLNLEI